MYWLAKLPHNTAQARNRRKNVDRIGGRSLAEGKMQTGIDEFTINLSELSELVLQGEDATRVSPGCECVP